MTSKAALFALLTVWGVGTAGMCLPANAEDAMVDDAETSDSSKDSQLTNRVWTKDEEDSNGLPGVMTIFLSDGTLVQDSCWETHRLSQWQSVSETELSWNEDGRDITAKVVTLDDNTLVLDVDGTEMRYISASAPFVCPDFPKE